MSVSNACNSQLVWNKMLNSGVQMHDGHKNSNFKYATSDDQGIMTMVCQTCVSIQTLTMLASDVKDMSIV